MEDQGALLSDDEIFASRQTGKHTCMALRKYFEAHLAIKLEQVKQSLQRTEGGILVHPQPPYKVRGPYLKGTVSTRCGDCGPETSDQWSHCRMYIVGLCLFFVEAEYLKMGAAGGPPGFILLPVVNCYFSGY